MTSSIFLVSTAKTYLMANQRKITWTSLYFHPRSFVKKIQQFLWSLWWLYLEKNEENDAEVRKIENHKTSTKSAWSKAFYRKTEKWRNWINSSKNSIASIIFSLFSHRDHNSQCQLLCSRVRRSSSDQNELFICVPIQWRITNQCAVKILSHITSLLPVS